MNSLTSRLRNKVDVYGKIEFENELGEKDFIYDKLKSIFANIVPQNLSGSVSNSGANTTYANTTHKIIARKLSLNLTRDMYFIYQGLRYDIEYFQTDFKNNEYWEILCKVRYE